jgi:2'-hydroxyisoflavone reductase
MRILVLGGTAFLSAEIAGQAVAAGHQVTCLARGSAGQPPSGAAWIRADRSLGANAYAGVSGDWDAVIEVARDPDPAQGALDALAQRAGHWTFVSSCSVYADHSIPGAAEDAALLPALPSGTQSTAENYGESKVAIEGATLAAAGGRVHVCRAGLIGGPGDGSDRYGYWPGRFARDSGPVIVPEIDADPTQVIDVRDLAAWILLAAEQGTSGVLNAVGDQVPFGQYVGTSGDIAGYTGSVVAAPEDWLVAEGVGVLGGTRFPAALAPAGPWGLYGAQQPGRAGGRPGAAAVAGNPGGHAPG